MFQRRQPEPQTRTAGFIEISGWLDFAAGTLLLWALLYSVFFPALLPVHWMTCLLSAAIWLWGLYRIVLGCLNVDDGALLLVYGGIPVPLSLTLMIWYERLPQWPWIGLAVLSLVAHAELILHICRLPSLHLFGLLSALRAGRTFHPDGQMISGQSWPLRASSEGEFEALGEHLKGTVQIRLGPGISSRFAKQFPNGLDAPNLAVRFQSSTNETLDILTLWAGTKLRHMILNIFKAKRYDLFRNRYGAMVPYHTPKGDLDIWFRLDPLAQPSFTPVDDAGLRAACVAAVTRKVEFDVCVQRKHGGPWVAIARFNLEEFRKEIDQEELQYHPWEGRGFVPFGPVTEIRRAVYPASVAARPASAAERDRRVAMSVGQRLALYLNT